MADPRRRRPHNEEGPWFVDDTCIDCGTCMWMAPQVFEDRDGMSAVHAQPPERDVEASAALLACPTGSIGGPATKVTFPRPMDGIEDVWHCGYHDRSSFGAASYLVETEEGRIMVDAPRFATPLVRAVEAGGGLSGMVFSHQDDVAAHQAWHERFDAPRAIHQQDDNISAETVLEGDAGKILGLQWIHVPGHTRGHVVYKRGDVLWTGDHLAARKSDGQGRGGSDSSDGSAPAGGGRGSLTAFRRACWYDWDRQIESMRRLERLEVAHVLPGHGAPWHGTPERFQEEMGRLLDWMETVR